MAILLDICVAWKILILKILYVFLRLKYSARLDLNQTILFMDGHYERGHQIDGYN